MSRVTSDLEERVLGVRCVRWNPIRADEHGGLAPVSNFGDLLGPMIARRIVELERVRLTPSKTRRALTVGSVMHFAAAGDVVWGSGVNGKIATQPLPPSLDVRAVRGPLTRAVLTARGIQAPEVFGDPALLLARLWPDLERLTTSKNRSILVVPNLNESDRFPPEATRSPIGAPREIIADIASSEFVTGTSLHALVVADALGVPSRPIAPESESVFKYLDYYAGTGRPDVVFARTIDEARSLGPIQPPDVDLDLLLDAFPIDLWTGSASPVPVGHPTYLAMREDAAAQRDRLREGLAVGSAPETDAALGRLEMLSLRNPPLDGLTSEELAATGLQRTQDDRPFEEPLLSVVIPAHNVLPWLGETLESVLSQQVDLEVIVVDDHSTDGTQEVIRRIAADDPRVRFVDSVTRGGGTARNVGADHARGRYLAFCDGDDLVAPDAYRKLVDSLERSGSDIAFGDYVKFSPTRTWSPTANWAAYREDRQGIRLTDEPSLLNGRPCWNKVFRRSFWNGISARFPDVPRSNDIVPMVMSYLAADSIDVLPDVVYLYRERPGSSSMTARAESAASLLSYLTQELACARMIAAAGSPELSEVYATLILDRDGWVHLTRYLRSPQRDETRDDEIAMLVRQLLDTVAADRTLLRARAKRAVFDLVHLGKMELAAAVAILFSGDESSSSRRLASWQRIVDGPAVDGVDLLADAFFASRLTDAIAREVVQGSATDDDAVIGLVRSIPPGRRSLLQPVPEVADALEASETSIRRELTESRRRDAELVVLESGGSITLTLRSDGDASDVPALFDESTGLVVALRPVREGAGRADDRPIVRGRISAGRVPPARALRPVLLNQENGRVMSIRFAARTPEYSPFDRFLLHFDDRGVLIERRATWLVRAARRGARAARRRLPFSAR